jgi:hypothetical protein
MGQILVVVLSVVRGAKVLQGSVAMQAAQEHIYAQEGSHRNACLNITGCNRFQPRY